METETEITGLPESETAPEVKQTLTDKVIDQLFKYIQVNQLSGGDELPTESELMELLHVSRGALREALCHLKALGIISSRRGSGFKVMEPDMVDALSSVIKHLIRSGGLGLRRMYDYFRVLELGCVADAVNLISDEQLEELERCRANYERIAGCSIPVPSDIDIAEVEFHQAMMAAAPSRALKAMYLVMIDFFSNRVTCQGSEAYEPDYLQECIQDHNAIVDAFMLRSEETAYFALRHHLRWGETPSQSPG